MSNEASPEPRKSGETRQQRAQRPAWIAGGVLILIGIVFIVQNVAGVTLNNWWALFILIPAIGLLVTTYQTWLKNDRRFTAASRGPLIGALALLGVTAVFLFNLDWGKVWPLFLILAGLAVLLSSLQRKS